MFNLRYSREIALKEISLEGYQIIRDSRVCMVGIGATGSPAADLFARAGVAGLRLIDGDTVDISNIHRQVLYTEKDVGQNKVDAAAKRLQDIDAKCRLEAIPEFLNEDNAERFLKDCDLVIDGTDNMETRRTINRYCVNERKPWVFISSIGTIAQVKAVIPGKTACLECFVDPQAGFSMSCEETGVLASAPIMASSLAWTIGIRVLMGLEEHGDLHYIDPWNNVTEQIHINRNPQCKVCSLL